MLKKTLKNDYQSYTSTTTLVSNILLVRLTILNIACSLRKRAIIDCSSFSRFLKCCAAVEPLANL